MTKIEMINEMNTKAKYVIGDVNQYSQSRVEAAYKHYTENIGSCISEQEIIELQRYCLNRM